MLCVYRGENEAQWKNLQSFCAYKTLKAFPRLNVTGCPLIVAHMINGSEPTESLVALPPPLTLAVPGKVTGTGTLHVLPLAVESVAPEMVLPSAAYE